jgi:2-keto-3-deoxy-L-rhamnonate aldolase RhmA
MMSDMPAPTARELARNPLREKLAAGELASVLAVRLFEGPEIGRIAATAGFDALYVDLEHCVLTEQAASRICLGAREAGVTPLVRVPAIDPAVIGRVLDGGAMGLIVPQIESAADVRRALDCMLYPPLGRRSVGSGLPALHYRAFPGAQATEALNANTLVAVMIETAAALESVEEIAAVDGAHVLFVGAQDLSADLGIGGQTNHPRLREAVIRIRQACIKSGKALGIGGLAGQPDLMRELAAPPVGCLASMGTDLSLLLSAATQRAAQARGLR